MSLEAVEEILGALLDISRLDAGATRPEISDVPVADLMRMLEVEFKPLAARRGSSCGSCRRGLRSAPIGD